MDRDTGFPQPFKIGHSAVRWRGDEVESWLEGRPRKEPPEIVELRELNDELVSTLKRLRLG